jgi:autotransporter-associated beta strand protein
MSLILSLGSLDREIDRARRLRSGAVRRRCRHLRLESLETRITPSTWTGSGVDGNWSDGANWTGGAPGNGSSLIFPAGVSRFNSVNDLPAGTQFTSIEIDGSGYTLTGHALVLTQGITTTYTSGTSTDAMATQLGGAVSVGAGGELDLNGALTGSAGVTVTGGGTLGLGGVASNTYSGTTVVKGSALTLNKSGGAIAVPGDLTIGDGTGAATARLTAPAQIATGSNVTVNDKAALDLNGQNNTIGGLTLTGATVTTGTGTLTLRGDITATDAASEDVSSISGKLDLGGATRTITVAEPTPDTTPDTDLTISAVISDSTAGLTVTGGGTLELSGTNTYTGLTTITGTGTTLLVDGTVGPVQVGAGTTLGGSGTVGDVDVVSGTVTPGNGNGPLNTGSLALDTSSTFAPQLVGPASVAFGQVVASGAVTLDGTLATTLSNTYTPVSGDKLTIIRNNSGLGVTGTFAGLAEGSTVTISSFPFQITYQGGSSGHDVVLTALKLPTTTTITTSSQNSTYGQSLTLTATVSGFSGPALSGSISFYDGNPTSGGTLLGTGPLNSQDKAIFSTKTLNVAGSPHQIYAVYSGSTSYATSTTTSPASVTISPATVIASLTGTVSKTYDGTTAATLAPGNFQLSGVVGNDVVSLNNPTSGTYDTKDVGSSKIVTVSRLALSGKDAGNYILSNSTVSGPVGQIGTKALTVTGITALNKVYDGTTSASISASGATLSGVIGGDNASLVTGEASGSFNDKIVGTNKAVSISGLSLSGTDAGNYTIAPVTGVTASITPAPLTVTANSATMTYGGTLPNLAFSLTGLVGPDTKGTALAGALATAATSKSHVGSYSISQGTLAAVDGDYTITFTGANFSVTPAPLTIMANNATKLYGAAVPSLTATYSGFKNGDTAASLTMPPSLTTAATASSPVGTYSINVANASSPDYTITDVPGTLTVTKASTSTGLTGATIASVVGQAVTYIVHIAPISPGAGEPTGTVSFLVDGRPVATANVDPTTGQASFSTSSLGHGSHTITAAYSGDADFAPSQSGSVQDTVAAAGTQSTLTVEAVRNKRGKITKVELLSQVLVVSPGGGVPTGVVTYVRKGRPIKTVALHGGRAELTLRANRALKRPFTVQYGGDGSFGASTSAAVVPTAKSLKSS